MNGLIMNPFTPENKPPKDGLFYGYKHCFLTVFDRLKAGI